MIAAAMGWIGTVGSIGAYVALSRGRWHATSLRYSALNALAGALAGTASLLYGAWPSVGANVVWTAIAVHSLLATLRVRWPALRWPDLAKVSHVGRPELEKVEAMAG